MSPTNPQSAPSIWNYKPWWCQPWSIILTGVSLIGGSWLLLHQIWITLIVAVPITLWMTYFIGIYPKLMAEGGYLPTPESDPES